MPKNQTLVDVFKDKKKLTTLGARFINGASEEEFISYSDLYSLAINALALLQKKGLKPKDELVIQIEDNKTLIVVFWACILGGIIPVPVSIGRNDEHKRKLFLIWNKLNNPYIICSEKLMLSLEKFSIQEGLDDQFEHFISNQLDVSMVYKTHGRGKIHKVKHNDIAFVQFSSGSTGTPKGVVLTHENLITNIMAIADAAEYSRTDSLMSWMPLTHDMGMIGFHINPLFCGMNHLIMPTSLFVRKPALWFDKVSEHKVTVLGSPNFGYNYILKHCSGKKQNWDLNSVRLIYNGAEPISADLCDVFLDYTSNYGLKRNTICPVYGLAEASLAVSISGLKDEVIAHTFLRNKLNIGDKVTPTNRKENSVAFVNVGKRINDCKFQIVNENYDVVDDYIIGNVMIKGKNVTKGYYNDPNVTENTIGYNGWLKTGDLGFVKNESLYITGRAKDIIFVNGQNYYPHDIEKIAEEVSGVELNKIVVVGYHDHHLKEERIISFVFYRGKIEKFSNIADEVKEVVSRKIGVEIAEVLPVTNIPRTTSGKLQRYKMLKEYQKGSYHEISKQLREYSYITIPDLQPPSNENERKIAQIWQSILKIKEVGVNQSFFDLGGNSLKLGEMAMELQKEFGIELPYGTLYEMRTIRQICAGLASLDEKEFESIPRAKTIKDYPLSQSQERLYYAWALDRTSTAYNIPVAFEINGSINFKKLEAAINNLVARYALLRASFSEFQEPRFSIIESVDFKLKYEECKFEDIDTTLRRLVEPFNLVLGNLFRVKVLRILEGNHMLFVDFHHIIADGLSVHQFIEELITFYNGENLPEMHIDYKDYVFWQQEDLVKEKSEIQEKYWLDTFEEGIPVLDLPIDYPRKKIRTSEGKRIQFQIDKKSSNYLKKLAKNEHATLHTVLFSMYKWMLSKLSGQHSMVIGVPTSGRTHLDLKNMLGMFANNLAIKVNTLQNESFQDSLRRDIEILRSALKNQDYPYARLVEKLDIGGNVSRNPLFDTMFLFPQVQIENKAKDFQLKRYFFDPGYSKFDLSMEIIEGDNISYILEYSSDLFEEATIERFAIYFNNLVKQLLNNPKTLFSETSILPDDEYKEHIEFFNATETDFIESENNTIVSLFEIQALLRPQQIALEFGNEQITYKELNEMAERFITNLKKNGVLEGDVVSVCLKRSPELIAMLLAILKMGAVYLPIDSTTPLERISYIIKDVRSKALVCHSSEEKLKTIELRKIYIDKDIPKDLIKDFSRTNHARAKSLAYIIYTSGTTGNPKGVMVSHESLLNYINWGCKEYIDGTPATFAFFTSIGFDLTLTSIFLPLSSGNKIVIYENALEEALTNVLEENKSTHLKLTPSHMKMAINNRIMMPTNLEKLIVGGEKLVSDVATRFMNLCEQKVAIYNEYGPTEATIGCMVHKFNPTEAGNSVPIGIPIANSKIYLLDELLNPVPIGVFGELYISGSCLAKGYFNNDELTNEKFVPNPFINGELMYKSGDLARKMPSGIIDYIGRKDNQIKIKGHRIEMDEVRFAILKYHEISDVVITSNENTYGELELYAYYITNKDGDEELLEIELKSFLLEKLPYYMIPLFFVEIDQIPMNKNGKVDYNALHQLKRNEQRRKHVKLSSLQEQLIEIYKELLEGTEVTIDSNFYELGGDSIKAAQIVSKLYQENIKITPKEVLIYHTIEELAYFIEHNDRQLINEDSSAQEMVYGSKVTSPIESWFLSQNFHNPSCYNQSILLDLKKQIKVDVFEKAFKKLIEHHDGLRLNLDLKNSTLFFNENHLYQGFEINRFSIKSDDQLTTLLEHIKGGFNLEKSLLLKVAIIQDERSAQNSEMLFITAHHLIVDGMSWRIFTEDLYTMCNSILEEKSLVLPKKSASLPRYQHNLAEFVKNQGVMEEQEYWNSIEEIEFSIPLDFNTDEWIVDHLQNLSGEVDEINTAWLLTESKTHNVDILTIMYMALVKTLGQWAETNQIKIETENHGRHLANIDVSRTIGWFTVMHPIVFNLRNSMKENLREVREKIKNIPNHGMGYGILKAAKILECQKEKPVEVRFNYLGQFGSELSNDFFGIRNFATGRESDLQNRLTARLEINAMIVDNKLQLDFLYNCKAHKDETIVKLKKTFLQHLFSTIDFLANEEEYLLTPSDFDAVSISQDELDLLFD